MYEAGVSIRALLDATYVCVGFNIIARIADALGFKVPPEELFQRAARLLRIFGYRRLSGFWLSYSRDSERIRKRVDGRLPYSRSTHLSSLLQDPYAQKMERLRYAIAFGPGALPSEVRQTIIEGGMVDGALGVFVRKVAEHAFTVSDEDILELHRERHTDDQIFEATVAAALRAGLFRLQCVLTALSASQSDMDANLGAQSDSLRIDTPHKITA